MKIAVVCGHFLPSMGYMEVYLAKEFFKLGHKVNVFTSDQVPAYLNAILQEPLKVGVTTHAENGYTITRLKPWLSVGQMVICKGLEDKVLEFKPNLVLVIGLGKLFPKPLLNGKKRSYKLITLLGDNSDNHEPSKRKPILDSIKSSLKHPLYKKAIKHSDHIFSYTPETVSIVEKIIPNELRPVLVDKNINISLGFDIEKFFLVEEECKLGREKLNIPEDDLILITATRIIEHKRFENVINFVDDYNKSGKVLHYVIIGFFEDEYGNQLKQFIEEKEFSRRFHCFPFLDHENVRELYLSADFAYFPTAVISIFEAMGTGLPVVLPNRPNVSHIVNEGETGWYFNENEFVQAIEKAAEQLSKIDRTKLKRKLAEINKTNYSYSKIAEGIIAESFLVD
tara:strand:- start:7005 stop:8192 length:1188 start_codon:yes stop_codon:yes gene_type:complete